FVEPLRWPPVAPTVNSLLAEQAAEPGSVGIAVEIAGRDMVLIIFLRDDELPAIIGRQVDPQAGDLARERSVPGIAVPHDRAASRHLDRNRVGIAIIAVEATFADGWVAREVVATRHHRQRAALLGVIGQ